MNNFEQEYYENEEFWKPGVFGTLDQERVHLTATMLPEDVSTLLDAGCGNGLFCNYLDTLGKNIKIIGLDRSKAALNYVKTEKVAGDIANMPFADNTFDCVTCLQVIEHLPTKLYAEALNELSRVSKKYMIISVPYEEKIEKNVAQCPGCKTIFNKDLHLRSFTLHHMKELFLQQGFVYMSSKTTGSTKKLIGFSLMLKLLNKKKESKFIPICPICGFENKDFEINVVPEDHIKKPIVKKGLIRLIKNLIISLWPAYKTKDYWIIAVYKKQAS